MFLFVTGSLPTANYKQISSYSHKQIPRRLKLGKYKAQEACHVELAMSFKALGKTF